MKTLREARAARGFCQQDLADILQISQVEVSYIEIGQNNPKIKTRQKIESVLGPIDFLNSRPLPKKKLKRQPSKHEIENRFIKVLNAVNGLEENEKIMLLYPMIDYLVKYTNKVSESKFFDDTKWDLILSNLRNWVGVKN